MASPARRNAAANYVNFITMAGLGFALNPLLLQYLGASGFGAWRALQRVLDFASVSDGRATQALKWVIAYRGVNQDGHTRRREVGAAIAVWAIWLPILVALVIGLVVALPHLIAGISPPEVRAIQVAGTILGLNVALAGLLSIPDSILVGTNQGYRSMTITTVVTVASNIAMVAVAWSGGGVADLAVVVLVATIANGGITLIVARRKVPWLGAARPNRPAIVSLSRFSGWILCWTLLTKLLLSTELIVISTALGARAVSDYTLTSYVATFALSMCLMTGSALMPQLGSLLGQRRRDVAGLKAHQAKEATFAIAVLAGSAMLLFNGPFVALWVGEQHYLGDTVNALIAVELLQLALMRNDAQIQDAALSVRGKVLVGALGIVASLGVGLVVLHMTDSISAMFIAVIVVRSPVNFVYARRVALLVPGAGLHYGRILLGIALLAASYAAGAIYHVVPPGWLALSLSLAIWAAVVGCIVLFAVVSPSTRRQLLGRKFGAALKGRRLLRGRR